ncbi:MAG TPA: hypothetical protein PLU49_09905, partial [Saprospiraceae bacterium]|nr:hypothetical protein [Saprospiraceae bacterium]
NCLDLTFSLIDFESQKAIKFGANSEGFETILSTTKFSNQTDFNKGITITPIYIIVKRKIPDFWERNLIIFT